MRNVKIISLSVVLLFIAWVIAVFSMLPVIPFVETEYSVDGEVLPVEGFIVSGINPEVTRIEIPDYFPGNDQCVDFWFTALEGKHILTVTAFDMTAYDEAGQEIERDNAYLFWAGGSEEEQFQIENYPLESSAPGPGQYVYFRSVFDLSNEDHFVLHVESTYTIDGENRHIDKKFDVRKNKKLTWNEFRVH
jgi:hypothetical protein